ncbi:guanine nucleotide-binding protein subunit alpha homolog [Daphnia magna]|uniref:GNA12/13 guanine nucleotide binding protein, alpha 12/13 n=2 Tax=Daphnia magna TaxID=35525 RepID=A0A0N8DNV3_9CRUS|nr:guanine nucleotide-binding protein subunit alpha homolog [Daphnia magna]KAK4022490.1 hypothetical protein OUZ56_007952 [Daphnia magna]KZS09442.1 GNA12/13 guanine nucleotide binding protein, alpha 12/13 [Daphnia magna]
MAALIHCCLQWKYSDEEIEQIQRSLKIDKAIEREKQSNRRQVKLLLLGAGESGKSTFLKQMRIIHGVKFETEAIHEFQSIVYQNIIRGMRVLVDAREKLCIPWESENNANLAPFLLRVDNVMQFDTKVFMEYAVYIQQLWQDHGIQEAYERRREFQLSDSVKYFFENLERIAVKDYLPNNQDILHARKATKGVTEFVMNINSIPFRFVDVGGQRSQRQKWLQCFDSITAILFLVSSSEYDQVLMEDRRTKRLEESINIFDTIVNIRYLLSVAFILFLNKTDLLTAKLSTRASNIAHYFPDYKDDPYDLSKVQAFILNMFVSARRNSHQVLYHHFTTAVDTENINKVFGAVKDFILQKHLENLMLQ